MAIYVVGDVQGCFLTFQQLLADIEFDEQVDRMILLGDVINRGPHSLSMLRFLGAHQSSMQMVLGNHEVFAIALALDATKSSRAHTLHDLLAAPDKDELINFLRIQPFIRQIDDAIFVHAGIMPSVSIETALQDAAVLSQMLMSDEAASFLKRYFEKIPTVYKPDGGPRRQLRYTLAYLTLLRMCESPTDMDLSYNGDLAKAPSRLRPWFTLRNDPNNSIFFGHWAALGLHKFNQYYCLDSGCVWGNKLTAIRLSDQKLWQVDNIDMLKPD